MAIRYQTFFFVVVQMKGWHESPLNFGWVYFSVFIIIYFFLCSNVDAFGKKRFNRFWTNR